MKPELKLAQMLSTDETEQKLASMSIPKLMQLIKDRKKDAPPLTDDVVEKKSSSEPETNEADSSKIKKDMEKDEKLPPEELLKKAEAWGRELAHKEKTAVLAFGAGKVMGALGGAAKAIGGAAKAIPGAIKAAPGAAKGGLASAGNFLKKDFQATKQQFSAGMKGQARPGLAKTPVPGVHHNAMPAAPVAAPAAAPKPGMSSGMKTGLMVAGAGAAGMGAGMSMGQKPQQPGMMRTASVKTAFSITSKGHKFDAEKAEMRKDHYLKASRHLQDYEALGYQDPDTKKNPAKALSVLRFGHGGHTTGAARHEDYVAKKHRAGKNAWNPLGGALTALPEEEGGTSGLLSMYGRVKKAGLGQEALKAAKNLKGPAMSAAKTVGNKAHGAVKALGSHIGKIQDPILKGTAIGAVTGGAGGAVSGLLDPKEDPITGEKQRMKSMMRRGLSGAAGGAATGALFGSIGKTSSVSVQKLASALEKRALGMAGIGSMAKNFVGQMKPVAQKAMAAAKPMVQGAMAKAAPMATKALAGKSMGQVAGMGAAAGGALGAAKGLVAPGKDATGQSKSRLGAMARGAVGGAALGAGAAAGTKAALPAMKNAYKAVTPGLAHAPHGQMSLKL